MNISKNVHLQKKHFRIVHSFALFCVILPVRCETICESIQRLKNRRCIWEQTIIKDREVTPHECAI